MELEDKTDQYFNLWIIMAKYLMLRNGAAWWCSG